MLGLGKSLIMRREKKETEIIVMAQMVCTRILLMRKPFLKRATLSTSEKVSLASCDSSLCGETSIRTFIVIGLGMRLVRG